VSQINGNTIIFFRHAQVLKMQCLVQQIQRPTNFSIKKTRKKIKNTIMAATFLDMKLEKDK
jgi:hypothetical protein